MPRSPLISKKCRQESVEGGHSWFVASSYAFHAVLAAMCHRDRHGPWESVPSHDLVYTRDTDGMSALYLWTSSRSLVTAHPEPHGNGVRNRARDAK